VHQQIRTEPTLSPPDVEKLLSVLKKADVNIVAVGGGGLEHGGKIVFACDDEDGEDQTQRAVERLAKEGYAIELVTKGMNEQGYLHVGAMRNRKGELAREIRAARKAAGAGYVVEDVAVGVPHARNGESVFPVQVFIQRAR